MLNLTPSKNSLKNCCQSIIKVNTKLVKRAIWRRDLKINILKILLNICFAISLVFLLFTNSAKTDIWNGSWEIKDNHGNERLVSLFRTGTVRKEQEFHESSSAFVVFFIKKGSTYEIDSIYPSLPNQGYWLGDIKHDYARVKDNSIEFGSYVMGSNVLGTYNRKDKRVLLPFFKDKE